MVPEGWTLMRLTDLAEISSGGTPSREDARYWNGHIPWVTTAEICNNTIQDTHEKITTDGLANSSAKLFPAGTVLLAMYGQGKTRGQVARLGIEATTNQACAAILPNENYHSEFLFQNLLGRYEEIRNISNDGSQKNLSGALVKTIPILVPPRYEQERIAHILAKWDESIAIIETLLENSLSQKKALMQRLLSGRKRLPGFNDNWRRIKLGNFCNRVTTKNDVLNDNVLTISAQAGLVPQETFFNKRVASETLEGYFLISRGQFAYNKSYSNGYPMGAIKRLNDYEKGVVTTLYICFEVSDTSICDPSFLEHYFDQGLLNRSLSKIANEGGRAHGLLNVKPNDFFNMELLIPSLKEQQAINDVLTCASRQVKVLEDELEYLSNEKKALMQQLLSGKRRVRCDEAVENAYA